MLQEKLAASLKKLSTDASARKMISCLATTLARRSAALLRGTKAAVHSCCPVSGVLLAPPRMGLLVSDLTGALRMIRAAADFVGFPFVLASPKDDDLSAAIRDMHAASGSDRLMSENGIIYCEQRRIMPDLSWISCAVVVAARRRILIPDGILVFGDN